MISFKGRDLAIIILLFPLAIIAGFHLWLLAKVLSDKIKIPHVLVCGILLTLWAASLVCAVLKITFLIFGIALVSGLLCHVALPMITQERDKILHGYNGDVIAYCAIANYVIIFLTWYVLWLFL